MTTHPHTLVQHQTPHHHTTISTQHPSHSKPNNPPAQLSFLEREKHQLLKRKTIREWELTREQAKRPAGPPIEALANKPSLPPSEPDKLLPGDMPNVQPPITGFKKVRLLEATSSFTPLDTYQQPLLTRHQTVDRPVPFYLTSCTTSEQEKSSWYSP